jgi:DNA-binding beta-propeller fold protein YncE
VGTDPVAIAAALDGNHLWVADGVSHQLYFIDEPIGTHITDVGMLPGAPRQLLNQGGTVWAALGAPGALVAIEGPGR